MEVEHPAAKVLIKLTELQDREVGDGTTYVVIIATEFLKVITTQCFLYIKDEYFEADKAQVMKEIVGLEPRIINRTSIIMVQHGGLIIIIALKARAKHLRGTVMKSSAVISSLVGSIQQMSLANHLVKGLYFTLAGGPEILSYAVTNFHMSHYDVMSITNNTLPIGGLSSKNKNSNDYISKSKSHIDQSRSEEKDPSPASPMTFASQPPSSTVLSFVIPIKQDPSYY
ncbi:hypothetical protein RJT34_11678 [Clitoria ternatea]|uniref:O-acyltransferase WSD1 C-terminal domain-containing protein n=1 Tax=Clitoria ternatea TaxID=43366 RepID=A0AAN9PKQ0_CLITE